MTNYPSLPKTALAVSVALIISGCGGGGGGGGGTTPPPGSGTATPATIRLSGAVVDGYVKEAKVCLDLNLNGRCDDSEPSVTTSSADTGNPGRFTLELLPADDNNTSWITHPNFKTAPLVVEGGTDDDTGLAFESRMSTPRDPAGGNEQTANITALSSLLRTALDQPSALGRAALEASIRDSLGLPTDADLGADPIQALADNQNAELLAAAVAVNRAIQTLNGVLGAADDEERRELSDRVYQALTQVIGDEASQADSVDTLLEAVAESTEAQTALAGGEAATGDQANRLRNATRLAVITATQTRQAYQNVNNRDAVRQAANTSTNVIRMVQATVESGRVDLNANQENFDNQAAVNAARQVVDVGPDFNLLVTYLETRLPDQYALITEETTALKTQPAYTSTLGLRRVHDFIDTNLAAESSENSHRTHQQAVLSKIQSTLVAEIPTFLSNLGYTSNDSFTTIEALQWSNPTAANYLPSGYTVNQVIALQGFPATLKTAIDNTQVAINLLRNSNISLSQNELLALRGLSYFYTGTLNASFTLAQLQAVPDLPASLQTKIEAKLNQQAQLDTLLAQGYILTDPEQAAILALTPNAPLPASVQTKINRAEHAINLLQGQNVNHNPNQVRSGGQNQYIYKLDENFTLRDLAEAADASQALKNAIRDRIKPVEFTTSTFNSSNQCPSGGLRIESGFMNDQNQLDIFTTQEICNGSGGESDLSLTDITPLTVGTSLCNGLGGYALQFSNGLAVTLCHGGGTAPQYDYAAAKALVTDLQDWLNDLEDYATQASNSLNQQAEALSELLVEDAINALTDALGTTLNAASRYYLENQSGTLTLEALGGSHSPWIAQAVGQFSNNNGVLSLQSGSPGINGLFFVVHHPDLHEYLDGLAAEDTAGYLVQVTGSITLPAASGQDFQLELNNLQAISHGIQKQHLNVEPALLASLVAANQTGKLTLASGSVQVTTSNNLDNLLATLENEEPLGNLTFNLSLGTEENLVRIETLGLVHNIIFEGHLRGELKTHETTLPSLGWSEQQLASISNALFQGKLTYQEQELTVNLGLDVPQTQSLRLENFTLAGKTLEQQIVELNAREEFKNVLTLTAAAAPGNWQQQVDSDYGWGVPNSESWGLCEATHYTYELSNGSSSPNPTFLLARYGEMVDFDEVSETTIAQACAGEQNAYSLYVHYATSTNGEGQEVYTPVHQSTNSKTQLLNNLAGQLGYSGTEDTYFEITTGNSADGTVYLHARLDIPSLPVVGNEQSYDLKIKAIDFDIPATATNHNRYTATARVALQGIASATPVLDITAKRTGVSTSSGELTLSLTLGDDRQFIARYVHLDVDRHFSNDPLYRGQPLDFTFSNNQGTLLKLDNNLGTANLGIYHLGTEHGRLYMDHWGDWIAVFGDGTEQRIYFNP